MTVGTAVLAVGALGSVGVAIDALEFVARRRTLSERGIFAPSVLRTGWGGGTFAVADRPLTWLFAYPQVLGLLALQLAGAAVLLGLALTGGHAGDRALGATAAATILASRMLFFARNQYGHDGSDQMFLVVFGATTVAWLGSGTDIATAAMLYLAGQAMLAYAVAGIAKVVSPVWRGGGALEEILDTVALGWPPLAGFLRRHGRVSRLACAGVVAFECVVPLLVLAGTPWVWLMLAGGVLLHVGTAFAMGLNNFLWAFCATYPAILLLADRVAY